MKNNIPSWLNVPSTSKVDPPTVTKKQNLPFQELSWEDFEKLCVRIVRKENIIEYCRQYGKKGEKQEGIDIYAQNFSQEKYTVFQCKRYRTLTPSVIGTAVKKFLDGKWAERSAAFVFCTNEDMRAKKLSEEFETQVKILERKKITFRAWDQQELNVKLKDYPEIVHDFFGLPWVEVFCGEKIAKKISGRNRLDPAQVIEYRKKIGNFYSIVFSKYDIGLPLLDISQSALSLKDRFIIPDILEVRTSTETIQDKQYSGRDESVFPDWEKPAEDFSRKHQRTVTRKIETRVDIQQVLTGSDRHIILGEPGVGKSTLIRFITLDLLSTEPKLSRLSEKWGSFLPVWIPFAFLTKKIERQDISLSELIHSWFNVMGEKDLFNLVNMALEDERLLLLVDGIDEWKDTQSARVAINRLSTFIELKKASAVMTSRPYGYKQLNVSIDKVKIHTLTGFSEKQQGEFITKWTSYREKIQNSQLTKKEIEKSAQKTSDELLKELQSAPKLMELAQYPLLLSILLSLKLRHLSLPQDRFEAYKRIIESLLEKHPQERLISAEISEPFTTMHPEDVTSIFEYLAYHTQTNSAEGLIDKKVAGKLIEIFCEKEMGYPKAESCRRAREMLELLKNFLGVLIERSNEELGFFHRLLQEYLAARYISKQPFEEQLKIIKNHTLNPQWGEVILGVINEVKRKDEVKAIIEVLEKLKNSVTLKDQYNLNLLIYEIVFGTGSQKCDLDLIKRIFEQAVNDIEFGFWMPYREKVLNIFIDGLQNSKIRTQIIEKIKSWFPGRFRYSYDDIINHTEKWEETPQLIDCLWKNIFNSEDIRTQKSAAKALAERKKGDAEWGNRFAHYCITYPDPEIRAVMFEGVLTGWPQHPIIKKFISINIQSASHILRFMAIKAKVILSIHDDKALNEILFLATYQAGLCYDWENDLADIILKGWKGKKELKKESLKSIVRILAQRTFPINKEIAWRVLLEGYINDKDVEMRIVEEMKCENYPFAFIGEFVWEILGKYWKENEEVSKAVESWILRQEENGPNIYYAAFTAPSDRVKQKLFSLTNSGNIFWLVKVFLEIWGNKDQEVKVKLKEIISSSLYRCSEIAHLLPDMLPDKEQCKNKLIEIMKSPDVERHDTLVQGLAQLSDEFDFTDSIDYLIDEVLERKEIDFWRIKSNLIEFFPGNKRVREIAKNELLKSNYNLHPVIKSYYDDPYFFTQIIQAITPFPNNLRSILVNRLRKLSQLSHCMLPILKSYLLEDENSIHTEAYIAFHTQLKEYNQGNYEMLKSSSSDINYPDFPSDQIMQSVFVQLLLSKNLYIINKELEHKNPHYSFNIGLLSGQRNSPLFKIIFEHWNSMKEIFGDKIWRRLFAKDKLSHYDWDELAEYIDEDSAAKYDLLEFIRSQREPIHSGNILNFISRIEPKSKFLLDTCIDTLKRVASSDLTAAYLIGTHFKGDKEVLIRVLKEFNIPELNTKLIHVLCFGWPDHPLLENFFEMLKERNRDNPINELGYAELLCTIRPVDKVVNFIDWILEKVDYIGKQFLDRIKFFLKERVLNDNNSKELLSKKLLNQPTAHQKVTYTSLLKETGALSEKVRRWSINEIERQRKEYVSPEIGFDIMSGEFKTVMHALLDAIS